MASQSQKNMANKVFAAVEHEIDGKLVKSAIRISEIIAVVGDKIYTKDSRFRDVKNSQVVIETLLNQVE